MTTNTSRAVLVLLATFTLGAGLPAALAQPALPGAPANLQGSVNGNNLSLTWNAPASGGAPTGYTLVARTTPGGQVLANVPVGNVTAFGAVGPNGVFVISVVASNAAGTGPESSAVTLTLPTVPAPPGPPSNLSVGVAGGTGTFTWTPPSTGGPVANYVFYAGLTPGFAVPVAALSLPATSAGTVIAGIPPGTYYVRVAAQNAGGTSAPSNEVTVAVAGPTAPGAPTLQAGGSGNTLSLSWSPGSGGTPTSYQLTALTPGGAVLATVPVNGTSVSFANVPNGTYVLRLVAVNAVGASPVSNSVTVTLPITGPPPPITPIGSDITSADANFGSEVALSANGQRVAVAARGTTNGTTRVYERTGNTWTQIGSDIIGEAAGDLAGTGLDINAAGTRVAIGAYLNDGGGTNSGHVRVYDLVGSTWTQVGADLDGENSNWGFGWVVALSASGNRLIASAPSIGGSTGHVKVYELNGGTWTQLGSTLTAGFEFGDAVDISADGTTIAVSAISANGLSRAGTAQVFRLTAGNWTQVGNTLQGEEIADTFGDDLSLSANGSRIAVSATSDREGGVSGGGDPAGKVRVFDLVGGTWTQVGNDVLGNVGLNGENLGATLALSDDGMRFAATGASQSVAKVYALVNGAWTQVGADITNNPGEAGRAEGIALSADGGTVAVGFVNGSPRRVRMFSINP